MVTFYKSYLKVGRCCVYFALSNGNGISIQKQGSYGHCAYGLFWYICSSLSDQPQEETTGLFVLFCTIPGSAQGLFLDLCSEITSGGLGGVIESGSARAKQVTNPLYNLSILQDNFCYLVGRKSGMSSQMDHVKILRKLRSCSFLWDGNGIIFLNHNASISSFSSTVFLCIFLLFMSLSLRFSQFFLLTCCQKSH